MEEVGGDRCVHGCFGWVGRWVGWIEENETVRIRCCTSWMGGWVGGRGEGRGEDRLVEEVGGDRSVHGCFG